MKADAFKAIKTGTQDTDASSAATGAYHSVAGYRELLALAQSITAAQGSVLTVELLQATDAAGTGSKTAGTKTATAGASGGAAVMFAKTVESLDVANGFTFVAVKTSVNEAVPASGVLLLADGRFS